VKAFSHIEIDAVDDASRSRRGLTRRGVNPSSSKVNSELFRDYGTSYALATIDQYPPPAPDDGITP